MASSFSSINTMDSQTATATPEGQIVTTYLGLSVAAQDCSELANLPRELLDIITSSLPTLDFNNLRLTCKLVENKIFPYWSNAFFKKKQFMMTSFSLQTLVDISRHATIGPCMTHLIIGLDYLKAIPPTFIWDEEDYHQYKLVSDAQDSLFDTGVAAQLLSTAFLNLRNLSNIDLRDFNSCTRYRDSSVYHSSDTERSNPAIPLWKSHGHSRLDPWSRYLAQDGEYCSLTGSHHLPPCFVDRVFKVLVAALGQSGSSVHGLEVLARYRHVALSDSAFAVSPILERTDSKLSLVLFGLTKLHLDLKTNQGIIPQPSLYQHPCETVFDMPTTARQLRDPATVHLRKFLSLTPNLTWFRLNNLIRDQPELSRFLFWLALDPEEPFGSLDEACWSDISPKPVYFPLRRLDLGTLTVGSNTLGLILKKFDKLESLSLRGITLYSEPSHDHQGVADENHHSSTWANFFQKLPVVAPNLKQLFLKGLTEYEERELELPPQRIVFGPTSGFSQVEDKWPTAELSILDKASLEGLADRTWTKGAWLAAKQAEHSPSGHASSPASEEDVSVEASARGSRGSQ